MNHKQQDIDKLFDQHLRDALDKLENEPATRPRWDLMEEMLDDEPVSDNDAPFLSEMPDEVLDDTIREALLQNKTPYKPKTWKALEAKLIAEEANELYKKHIRTTEIAILILALLTFVRFAFFEPEVVKSVIAENMPIVADAVQNFPKSTANAPEIAQKIAETTNSNVKKMFVKQPFVLLPIATAENRTAVESKIVLKPTAAETPKKAITEAATTSTSHGNGNTTNVTPPATTAHTPSVTANAILVSKDPIPESVAITSSQVPTTVEGEAHDNTSCVEKKMAIHGFSPKGTLRVGMVIHSDANYIKTPSVKNLFDHPFAGLSAGYGIGFTVGYQVNKWEVESGMIYAFKHNEFASDKSASGDFQNGYFLEQLRGIEWNSVKMPLSIRYQVAKQTNWTTYAKLGSAIDVIFSSNYNKQFQTSQPISTSNLRPLSKLPEANGLLEGGKLNDNYYMTANIGIGLERRLSDRTILLIEPMYQHQISNTGLGVSKDKIYTLSFNTGLKVNLSK
jgi:hypothetical protein